MKKRLASIMLAAATILTACGGSTSAPAVKTHAQTAVEKYGATKEEIFMVLATAMSLGGVPAYREACIALEEYLKTL